MSSPSVDVVEVGGISGGSAAAIRTAELLQFGTLWAPYGGGSDEDIFVTFGVPSHIYFTRLAKLLAARPDLVPDESTRKVMLAVCNDRSGGEPHQKAFTSGGCRLGLKTTRKLRCN